MQTVYHGTSAAFPPKQLTSGPDTSAMTGKPMPGLWLTTSPETAAAYASWSADCTGETLLRVITLEISRDCPRTQSPLRPEDLLITMPELRYQQDLLKVLRGYKVRRSRLKEAPRKGWLLEVPDLEIRLITANAATMAKLPGDVRIPKPE